MQDKFVGDIGDYAKYGLPRALSNNGEKWLGVAWYLHPDSPVSFTRASLSYRTSVENGGNTGLRGFKKG